MTVRTVHDRRHSRSLPIGMAGSTRQRRTERADRTRALFHSASSASAEDRRRIEQDIVIEYLDVADAVSRRYAHRNQDWNDLRQVARIGLVKAVRRFDASRGEDFVSFAVPTITGEIKRHLRDHSWVVRPPRHLQELHSALVAEIPRVTQELGRQPTAREMASDLGEELDAVVEATRCRHGMWPVSLDATTQDGETALIETLAGRGGDFERAELAVTLRDALTVLTPRERRIVFLRFFQERTQSEIGAELGVTQMQVSRLLTKILDALRDRLSPVPDAA